MLIYHLPINLQQHRLVDNFSLKEMKEMRCVDKKTNALVESIMTSLYNRTFSDDRLHSQYTMRRLWRLIQTCSETEIYHLPHGFLRREAQNRIEIQRVIRVARHGDCNVEARLTSWRHAFGAIGYYTPEQIASLEAETRSFYTRMHGDYSKVMSDLAQGKFSKEVLLRALFTAIYFNSKEMLSNFLSSGFISSKMRGAGLSYAIEIGREPIVRDLLATGPIEKTDREKAFMEATSRRQPLIAAALLANGPISLKTRIKAKFL